MEHWLQRLLTRWYGQRLAARLWWGAMASVATAGVVALAAVTLYGPPADAGTASRPSSHGGSGAVNQASGASGATGSMSPAGTSGTSGSTGSTGSTDSTGAMGSMTSTGSMGSAGAAASTGAMAAGTSPVCPNVAGTTVMPDGMVMAPVPAGPPTAVQQAAANQLVAETTSALAQYANLAAATEAGYVPATNPNGYVVHYANWQTVRSGDVLDPSHPSALVYANTVSGPVLLGAMYMGPGPCQPGPDVGGSLTQWHAHDNLCLSATTHQVMGRASSSGSCASGVHNTATYFMLHVWTAPSLASSHQFEPDLTSAEIAPIIRSGQP